MNILRYAIVEASTLSCNPCTPQNVDAFKECEKTFGVPNEYVDHFLDGLLGKTWYDYWAREGDGVEDSNERDTM
jgi:hypothetical protein